MGYKYQFITLAGVHNMWNGMFNLAYDYAREDMTAYVRLQDQEFADADKGYTFVAHQQEVGTGYFDDMTQVIQGGDSSVTALTGSNRRRSIRNINSWFLAPQICAMNTRTRSGYSLATSTAMVGKNVSLVLQLQSNAMKTTPALRS